MSLSPPSQDWMVLQCGACGNRMKVRREVAMASRLLCPGCRAPVPVLGENPAPQPAAFAPNPLPERTPPASPPSPALPAREGPVLQGGTWSTAPIEDHPSNPAPASFHPEFAGSLPASADDSEEGDYARLHPEQRRRAKIKKRKNKAPARPRYLELTDWDQQGLTEIPEAEIAADVWADARPIPEDVISTGDESEYLVESVEEADGSTRTRKKKVRRRRLLVGARLLFLRLTRMSRYFTGGLAVLLVGIAVYGFYVQRQKPQPVVLPPITEPPIDRAILTQYDALNAEQAVRDFLAADGIEAKLAFVRQPERIRPLMQRWYRGERTAGPLQAGEVAMQDKKGGEIGSTRYYVILAMPVFVPDPLNPGSTYEEMNFFALEEIRTGSTSTYLVDWETSTGYQDLPLDTYKATMPAEPYPFRIYLKPDNYYDHNFPELQWQCVALSYPGRNFHLYGYIQRTSLEGRKLLDLIEAVGQAAIIAELTYPPDAVSRDQVIVKRILHPSWFYDTAADAFRFGDAIEPNAPK